MARTFCSVPMPTTWLSKLTTAGRTRRGCVHLHTLGWHQSSLKQDTDLVTDWLTWQGKATIGLGSDKKLSPHLVLKRHDCHKKSKIWLLGWSQRITQWSNQTLAHGSWPWRQRSEGYIHHLKRQASQQTCKSWLLGRGQRIPPAYPEAKRYPWCAWSLTVSPQDLVKNLRNSQ